jgi:hypothetical protein
MVRWTEEMAIANQMKHAPKRAEPELSQAEKREMDLHEKIIKHCMDQWPRWKFLRARSDQKSTIQKGASDFTIFMPGGRTLCLECKSKGGKLSQDQLIWRHEMGLLGHPVHEVRSMDDFVKLL